MINFDTDMAAELGKEFLCDFWLAEFRFSTTHYITSLDVPVRYNGNNYLSRRFEFSDVVRSGLLAVDKITLELDNASLEWTAILLNEDVRNKDVIVSYGVRLSGDSGIRNMIREWFYGIARGWKLNGDSGVDLSIVNEFERWNERVLRPQESSCPWAFKQTGGECGYTGSETWCDQSYERCTALGNQLNFGGDRFMPDIAEREIWWGSVQGS